jgi:hypothetical protein
MPLLPTATKLVSEEVGAFDLDSVLVFRSLRAGYGAPLEYCRSPADLLGCWIRIRCRVCILARAAEMSTCQHLPHSFHPLARCWLRHKASGTTEIVSPRNRLSFASCPVKQKKVVSDYIAITKCLQLSSD